MAPVYCLCAAAIKNDRINSTTIITSDTIPQKLFKQLSDSLGSGKLLSTRMGQTLAARGSANTKPDPKRTSVQVTMIRVLQYLADNSEDVAGFTQHHLMTIEGLPTQNWTRFRKILKHLVSVGFIEQSRDSILNLFRITQKGLALVRLELSLLDEEIS